MSSDWKQGLSWGEEISENGSVKQTTQTTNIFYFQKFYSHFCKKKTKEIQNNNVGEK